jgi:uncharacterized cupin superfamily protein
MEKITIEHNPSPAKLDAMGVDYWAIWEKEISTFEWNYDTNEKCYILEGKAIVTPVGGDPVEINAYDLVNFSKGLSCTWEIVVPVKKHYILES